MPGLTPGEIQQFGRLPSFIGLQVVGAAVRGGDNGPPLNRAARTADSMAVVENRQIKGRQGDPQTKCLVPHGSRLPMITG